MEFIRMRNSYNVEVSTCADIQENVKVGGKVIEIYEGVIYRDNIRASSFKKVIDKLFELR